MEIRIDTDENGNITMTNPEGVQEVTRHACCNNCQAQWMVMDRFFPPAYCMGCGMKFNRVNHDPPKRVQANLSTKAVSFLSRLKAEKDAIVTGETLSSIEITKRLNAFIKKEGGHLDLTDWQAIAIHLKELYRV